jgi:hypothetical protein
MFVTSKDAAQMLLGETLTSCRKSESGSFITVADSIEALVSSQPGLTELEIAKALFVSESDLQRIHLMCRRLIAEGRLTRNGVGTTTDPFTYSPKRASKSPPRPAAASRPRAVRRRNRRAIGRVPRPAC